MEFDVNIVNFGKGTPGYLSSNNDLINCWIVPFSSVDFYIMSILMKRIDIINTFTDPHILIAP